MIEFKAGDRVVINTDDPHHTESSINFRRGDEGVVSAHPILGAVDTDGDIRVTFDGNRWAWVSPECLSKVGEPESTNNPIEPDAVNPDHYKFPGGAEVIDISEHLSSNGGQAVQYIARATRQDGKIKGNPLEDLRKSIWFINREIARLEALSA